MRKTAKSIGSGTNMTEFQTYLPNTTYLQLGSMDFHEPWPY